MNGTMRRSRLGRRGFALIDAVLSLAILAITAAGIIALLRQTTLSIEFAAARDRGARSAGVAMAGLSVRDPAWLDQHSGDSRYQSWALHLEHLTPPLYHAALADTLTGRVWVETTFYHPSPEDSNAVRR